jgi:hypothetical protein
MVDCQIELSYQDRLQHARYLGALADRVFRRECARLGLDADEAIKSPLSPISARQHQFLAQDDAAQAATPFSVENRRHTQAPAKRRVKKARANWEERSPGDRKVH